MNITEKIKHLNNQVYSVIHGKMVQVIPNEATIEFTLLTSHVRNSHQISSTSVQVSLMKNGALHEEGECLIFPSKENRDWNSIQTCQFKQGDLVFVRDSDSNPYQARFHTGKLSHTGINEVYFNQFNNKIQIGYLQCISLETFLSLKL
jgi:hypothetical protein